MALTSDQITAQNFADFYQKILPYLNGGGMGMKLLWENSDPTSNFSAGDVTLSSSDYDMLIVMYRMTTSRNYIKSVVIPKLSTAYLDAGYFTSADNQVIYYRTLSSVDDLTVHIYNASKAANSRETADNSVCIPYRIYGIKVYNRDVPAHTTLLWSNPDPSSAFAAQNIELANSDYDLLTIRSKWGKEANQNIVLTPIIVKDGESFRIYAHNTDGSTVFVREGSVSGNTVTFQAGSNTSYIIPIDIYGTKL